MKQRWGKEENCQACSDLTVGLPQPTLPLLLDHELWESPNLCSALGVQIWAVRSIIKSGANTLACNITFQGAEGVSMFCRTLNQLLNQVPYTVRGGISRKKKLMRKQTTKRLWAKGFKKKGPQQERKSERGQETKLHGTRDSCSPWKAAHATERAGALPPFPVSATLANSFTTAKPQPQQRSSLLHGTGGGFGAVEAPQLRGEAAPARAAQPRTPRPFVSPAPATNGSSTSKKWGFTSCHISLTHQAWALQVGVIKKPQARVK